jgi:hypothetical protein
MLLTAGKKTNKELAKWFGIRPDTLSKNKVKKLKELENFACFHLEKGKIVIDEVLEPEYSKKGGENYQKVKREIDPTWNANGLDTCSRVAEAIHTKLTLEDKDFTLKETKVYSYTRKGRNELYGAPFGGGGELGKCEYLWCKKTETGYEFLTKEEEQIKQDLIKLYFGDATEKQLLVRDMVDKGELKSEDAFEYLSEITGTTSDRFMLFLGELREKIGCQIVRGTFVEKSAF